MARALQNDPIYLGAQANLGASQARSSQALSALMPQVTASVNTAFNHRDYSQHSPRVVQNNFFDAYNSHSAQLNLTQPIWHHGSIIAMHQAEHVVEQSGQLLLAARQDVLIRLTQSWFDIMQARDAMTLARSQLKLAKYQFEQSASARNKGVASATELALAQGKYELAVAEVVNVGAEQDIRLAALEQIIGTVDGLNPPELTDYSTVPDMHGGTLEQWMVSAETRNPAVLAARYALDAADDEVRKQYAGHEPTLEMVASYGKTSQGAGISGGMNGFTAKTNSVGLQLSVPIFSGGGQSAKVRETIALKEKALQDMELAIRNARSFVKQAWFTWVVNKARQSAAKLNVSSTAFALMGVQQERAHGIKADVDVLQAEVQHETAIRDCRKAQYDMFINYFKLLAASGLLTGDELAQMNLLFNSAP